jgi:hypothetical protein
MQVYRLEPKGGDTRDPIGQRRRSSSSVGSSRIPRTMLGKQSCWPQALVPVLSLDSLSPLVLGCAVTLLIVFQIKRLGMSRPLA